MTLVEFLILMLIALICGSISQSLAGYSHLGCLATIALGFIGALLGRWLATALNLPTAFAISVGGSEFPVIWSIIGGALFAAILGLLARGRARPS